MKISELVAELSGHQPDGPVVIREIDAVPGRLLMVESIVKENGMSPLLMGRRIQSMAARNSLLMLYSERLSRHICAVKLYDTERRSKNRMMENIGSPWMADRFYKRALKQM